MSLTHYLTNYGRKQFYDAVLGLNKLKTYLESVGSILT
jgi:hypothetical protein